MVGAILGISLGVITVVGIGCAVSWYRVVSPSEAHLVVSGNKRLVRSSDPKITKDGKAAYFAVPSWVPGFGRKIRIMDLRIKEINGEMETYEKNQARYNVKYSLKYRIEDVETAAETFTSDAELKAQLEENLKAAVRAATVKYDVVEARANKLKMQQEIETNLNDDLKRWGLVLSNFVLVDFQDTPTSKIISAISKRREVEIESDTRQLNAEKIKLARMKEAESDEAAQKREILRDQEVLISAQNKNQQVAEKEKDAKTSYYKVVEVETVRQAEVDKEKALIDAMRNKEVQAVNKENKRLEGEGQKLYLEEIAKGEAAKIRESGFAEAEAKDRLQLALNKFKDEAIRALVAEKVVEANRQVGIATSEALSKADVKVFAGNKDGQAGFNLSQLVESMSISSPVTAESFLNKLARPNDLGLNGLDLKVENKKKA